MYEAIYGNENVIVLNEAEYETADGNTGKILITDRKFSKKNNESGKNEMQVNEYYSIPNWLHPVLTELGLTAQEKLVYECLLRYGHNSGNPFPSILGIQKFSGIGSKNTVHKALNKLYDLKLVEKISTGGKHTSQGLSNNTYKIYYPYYENKLIMSTTKK